MKKSFILDCIILFGCTLVSTLCLKLIPWFGDQYNVNYILMCFVLYLFIKKEDAWRW